MKQALSRRTINSFYFLYFRPSCFEQTLKPSGSAMKDSVNMNDFQTVTRFENLGGGWGYSGQSVEAIRFMADTDIVLSKYYDQKALPFLLSLLIWSV